MAQRMFTIKQASAFTELKELVDQVMLDPEAWQRTCAEIATAADLLEREQAVLVREAVVSEGAAANQLRADELDVQVKELADKELQLNARDEQIINLEKDIAARRQKLDISEKRITDCELQLAEREAALKVAEEAAAAAKLAAEKAEAASIKTQGDYNRALEGLNIAASVRI